MSDLDLADVYAVETRPGYYAPRSDALDTKTEPKLWVRRFDAQRVATKRNMLKRDKTARVVRFRLVRVEESDV